MMDISMTEDYKLINKILYKYTSKNDKFKMIRLLGKITTNQFIQTIIFMKLIYNYASTLPNKNSKENRFLIKDTQLLLNKINTYISQCTDNKLKTTYNIISTDPNFIEYFSIVFLELFIKNKYIVTQSNIIKDIIDPENNMISYWGLIRQYIQELKTIKYDDKC
jgi:hypothetical protein